MPTPRDEAAQGKVNTSQAAQRVRTRQTDTEPLLPGSEAPGEGLPLVVLAHGGCSHARGPHTLWLAWYLVRQYNCAVLAVDHLPHHGLRTPKCGSASCDAWPASDLGEGDDKDYKPWAEEEWERTMRRTANELGYALDIALALPSSGEIA